jgi:hypothetical protein
VHGRGLPGRRRGNVQRTAARGIGHGVRQPQSGLTWTGSDSISKQTRPSNSYECCTDPSRERLIDVDKYWMPVSQVSLAVPSGQRGTEKPARGKRKVQAYRSGSRIVTVNWFAVSTTAVSKLHWAR